MSAAPAAELKPCPACGQRAGALKTLTAARFPYYVACSACGWSTPYVRLAGVAAKLWNSAKVARGRKD